MSDAMVTPKYLAHHYDSNAFPWRIDCFGENNFLFGLFLYRYDSVPFLLIEFIFMLVPMVQACPDLVADLRCHCRLQRYYR